ncbi:hypothetical protein JOE61_003864 [Nocardioides salarius]|uniref:SGNH/GDSL hydrolase family protein n=1 Tax=Nocardioides salarius TaxID=374513 RepID=A0ABS2MFT5_9ACTN|nr:hypothetical protein [Nocardioides salarius]MBM7510050.1 hypothetical protein [Nocardioides salarius]
MGASGAFSAVLNDLSNLPQAVTDAQAAEAAATAAKNAAETAAASVTAAAADIEDLKTQARDIEGPSLRPLAQVQRARTGKFRLKFASTSIGNASGSGYRAAVEQLKRIHGDAQTYVVSLGGFAGSYENTVNGWVKQPYGGPGFVRLRGDSASTPLTGTALDAAYFDTLTVRYSKELDGGTFGVEVDGVVVGSVDCNGAQGYQNQATFTVAKGIHAVRLIPPASGYAYAEFVEFAVAGAAGIEFLDGSLGGSSLANMVTVRAPSGAQVAGIAIGANVGLDSYFGVDDYDMAVLAHIVNDAGLGAGNLPTFKSAVDRHVDNTRKLGKPLLVVVEAGAHYGRTVDANHATFVEMRDYLLDQRRHSHVTVLDWHGETWLGDDPASVGKTIELYYAATNYNPADQSYSGDFTHPTQAGYRPLLAALCITFGIPIPRQTHPAAVAQDAAKDIPRGLSVDRTTSIAGVATQFYGPPGAVALRALGTYQHVKDGAYVSPAALNNRTQGVVDALAASVTSNKWGKYIDYNAQILSLGTYVDWAAGERMVYTFRVAGAVTVRGSGVNGTRLYSADGQPFPMDGNGRSYFRPGDVNAIDEEPYLISVIVGATAGNGYFDITGRVFGIGAAKSLVPVLAPAAPY